MNLILAIGAGGALGSIARHLLGTTIQRAFGTGFPAGTLAVNVLGSFVIGLLYVWLIEHGPTERPELRAFLIVGLLGGFTTFSAFSMDTVALVMQASYVRAALNVLASVALCVLGTFVGVALARQV